MKTLSESDSDFVCEIQAPCFQALSNEEKMLIKSSRTQVQYRRGETINKQGTFASSIQFIISGLVKQHIEGDGERNFNLWVLQPGDFAGLSTLFDNPVYNYSTVAITETVAFLVEKEALLRIIKSNSSFAYNIITRYNEQHNSLFDTIGRLQYKQMNGRMADTLLYLSADNFAGFGLFSHLSRKDLAEFAGISTESAVKILKQLEKENVVALEDKNIVILKRDQLKDISKRG